MLNLHLGFPTNLQRFQCAIAKIDASSWQDIFWEIFQVQSQLFTFTVQQNYQEDGIFPVTTWQSGPYSKAVMTDLNKEINSAC